MDTATQNNLEIITRRFAGLLVKRPGAAVGLWGPPGIGKTHTAQQIVRATPCANLSLHATTSLTELVQQLPKAPKLPAWAKTSLDRLRAGEHLDTQSAANTVSSVLSQLAPFVLYLEDVHETAPEQHAFITALAQAVTRERGVGLIVTSRAELHAPFETVRLEPLSVERSTQMLEAEVGSSLPAEAVTWIHERAGGNPLFTLEFFRLLARQGFVWNDSRTWRWRTPERNQERNLVPVTVEAVVERLLSGAASSPELLVALGARSMLSWGANLNLWAAVADLPPDRLQKASAELERSGVLHRSEFAHPLFREVQRSLLSADDRQAFAARAVRALEVDHPEDAAEFVNDAAIGPEAALALLRRAANVLIARSDTVRAAAFLARAVDQATGEAQPALALEAARMVRHVNVPEAMRLAELARSHPQQRTEATYLIAELLAIQGRGQEAEQALESLPERGSRAWWHKLVQVRGVAHNDAGVLAVLREHPDLLENADSNTLARVARTLAHDGQQERAQTLLTHALKQPDLDLEQRVLLLKSLSLVAYARSDYARMDALEQEILALATQLGNLRWVDAAHFNRALALEALGDHAGRMKSLERAMQTCLELGDITALAIAQSSYAGALHACAEYERAETMFLQAHTILRGLDVSMYLVDCESGLTRLYLDWQPPHGLLLARKYASSALEHARALRVEHYMTATESLMAVLEAHSNQAEAALKRSTRALDAARRLEMPSALADALAAHAHALAASGRVEDAIRTYQESASISDDLGDINTAQLAWLEMDRLEGNVKQARARELWFKERGLLNGVRLVQRYFPMADPEPTSNPPSTLRLEVLGPMRLMLDGRAEPVRGRKRRELLALLLEARVAGRTELPRLEIFDVLYPEADSEQATNALKATVHGLRSVLTADAIRTTSSGYALGNITSDVEDFLISGDTRIWRSAYLDGLPLETPDESVREALHLALCAAAQRNLKLDIHESVRASRILIESNAYNTGYLRLALHALRASGNHKSLSRLYAESRQRLLEVGEVLPEHWQVFLEADVASALN